MIHSLTRTPDYQDWVWDLTRRFRAGLESAYSNQSDEVDCIRALVTDIAQTLPIGSPQSPRVRLTVESVFLHGPRSQVTFSVGGVQKQRELADVLVLSSFVYRGSLKWQRVCLIQAKRDNAAVRKSAARFDVDEWQLALLRTFPRFTGVSGVFKGLTYELRNQSGMLGAYGLLNSPGDISILSARVLYSALGGRKSLTEEGNSFLQSFLSHARSRRGRRGDHRRGGPSIQSIVRSAGTSSSTFGDSHCGISCDTIGIIISHTLHARMTPLFNQKQVD